jgi:hypothetical protein
LKVRNLQLVKANRIGVGTPTEITP